MSYPLVNIHNSTNYNAEGRVEYASIFCKYNDYFVTPNTSWQASSRGICLVTKISVVVATETGHHEATYTSPGTSYSKFVIIQAGIDKFEITRRVGAMEDQTPADQNS